MANRAPSVHPRPCPAPAPRLARLPFFYGWVVVAVAFVTMAIGVNARTAFSLLFPPILDEFGWDRATIALCLLSIACIWLAAPRQVRVVAGQVARLEARRAAALRPQA